MDTNVIVKFFEKIVPVFLGLSILTNIISGIKDIEYLKRYEPIGCRDEYTLEVMRNHGIKAYLNGCLTAAFPRVRNNEDNDLTKIFCVDISDELKKHIPTNIINHCIFMSHTYYKSELHCSPEEKVRQVYKTYILEAKMVITSRLHVAISCIATGFPVI